MSFLFNFLKLPDKKDKRLTSIFLPVLFIFVIVHLTLKKKEIFFLKNPRARFLNADFRLNTLPKSVE